MSRQKRIKAACEEPEGQAANEMPEGLAAGVRFAGRSGCRLLGCRLRASDPDAQKVEVRLGCNVLNRMLELGAAKSVAIGG